MDPDLVFFSQDNIRVVVTQPLSYLREPDSPGRVYNAARNQCWMRLLASPPSDFDVTMTGSVSSPVIEVSVLREGSLLQQIPLLCEIDSSTDGQQGHNQSDEETGDSIKQAAQFRLPCPIWGMISVLILLEGAVGIKPWFAEASSDPSLAQQTLQVLFCICD